MKVMTGSARVDLDMTHFEARGKLEFLPYVTCLESPVHCLMTVTKSKVVLLGHLPKMGLAAPLSMQRVTTISPPAISMVSRF